MTILRKLAVVATVALGFGLAVTTPTGRLSGAAFADEAGDLVFTDRAPWDIGSAGKVWTLDIVAPAGTQVHTIADGTLALVSTTDPKDGKPMLQLLEKGGGPERKIGPFPTDGGDPTVVFFLETVARNMAAISGGSPYYIRNRLKDAVFRGGELVEEGGAKVAVFRPFRDDPNKARMGVFEQLELRFVMDDPKAPIRSMTASTGGEAPAFLVSMVQP